MRELIIGDQTVRVRATNLALLFYRQEFKSDVLADLAKMIDFKRNEDGGEIDSATAIQKFDVVALYQIIWAMAKADAFGRGSFPSFTKWFVDLGDANIYDKDVMVAALEEAADGFFRAGAQQRQIKQGQ